MSKTCYMHFSLRKLEDFGLTKLFSEHSLELADVPIKFIRSTKFLGVIIDEELPWLPQTKKLFQKLSCQIGTLKGSKIIYQLNFIKIYRFRFQGFIQVRYIIIFVCFRLRCISIRLCCWTEVLFLTVMW